MIWTVFEPIRSYDIIVCFIIDFNFDFPLSFNIYDGDLPYNKQEYYTKLGQGKKQDNRVVADSIDSLIAAAMAAWISFAAFDVPTF